MLFTLGVSGLGLHPSTSTALPCRLISEIQFETLVTTLLPEFVAAEVGFGLLGVSAREGPCYRIELVLNLP